MGSDKALLKIGGTTFVERIAGILANVVDEVVISAGDEGKYSVPGIPVIADTYRNCGPLGGIHSALTHISTERVLIVSCDLPLVTAAACKRMVDTVTGNNVTIARCAGRYQPLFGVYNKNILPDLERCLREGRYAVMAFLDELIVTLVDFPDPALISNINTPEDYLLLPALIN